MTRSISKMNADQERLLHDLAVDLGQLADTLPGWPWSDEVPDDDRRLFEALQLGIGNLWSLWREIQIGNDLAA